MEHTGNRTDVLGCPCSECGAKRHKKILKEMKEDKDESDG